jgi:hypothetical protein
LGGISEATSSSATPGRSDPAAADSESTAVRVPSTRLRVPATDEEGVPTGIRKGGAPIDSVLDLVVTADATFVQRVPIRALAVAIRALAVVIKPRN